MNEQLQRLEDRYERATGKKLFDRPMTNADRIRAMSDEELADILYEADSRPFSVSLEVWVEWIKEPAEEDT
jgi:hypothetical protein